MLSQLDSTVESYENEIDNTSLQVYCNQERTLLLLITDLFEKYKF